MALLDDQGLIVEILDNVVMFVLIDFEDDGFDGGVAFDQDTCDCCMFCGFLTMLLVGRDREGGGVGEESFFSQVGWTY